MYLGKLAKYKKIMTYMITVCFIIMVLISVVLWIQPFWPKNVFAWNVDSKALSFLYKV